MAVSSFTMRMGIVILLVFIATAVAATLLKPGVDALVAGSEWAARELRHDAATGTYDFGRFLRHLFLPVAVFVVLISMKWLGHVEILGLSRTDRRWQHTLAGFLAGMLTWLLLILALVAAGRRGFRLEPADGLLLGVAGSLVAALFVGFIEELALRGYLLGGLRREWPELPAVLGASALYSILHFMKAPVRLEPGFDPLAGFTALLEQFGALANPGVLGGFTGLLLVGVVLSYAYLWTRSLPFAIGLHAGWVFLMQSEKYFVEGPTGTRAIYGSDGVLTDWLGWGFLLSVLAVLFLVTARRRKRAGV